MNQIVKQYKKAVQQARESYKKNPCQETRESYRIALENLTNIMKGIK